MASLGALARLTQQATQTILSEQERQNQRVARGNQEILQSRRLRITEQSDLAARADRDLDREQRKEVSDQKIALDREKFELAKDNQRSIISSRGAASARAQQAASAKINEDRLLNDFFNRALTSSDNDSSGRANVPTTETEARSSQRPVVLDSIDKQINDFRTGASAGQADREPGSGVRLPEGTKVRVPEGSGIQLPQGTSTSRRQSQSGFIARPRTRAEQDGNDSFITELELERLRLSNQGLPKTTTLTGTRKAIAAFVNKPRDAQIGFIDRQIERMTRLNEIPTVSSTGTRAFKSAPSALTERLGKIDQALSIGKRTEVEDGKEAQVEFEGVGMVNVTSLIQLRKKTMDAITAWEIKANNPNSTTPPADTNPSQTPTGIQINNDLSSGG